MKQIYRIFCVGLFLLILSFPMLIHLSQINTYNLSKHSNDPKISQQDENRQLATFPLFPENSSELSEITKIIDAYLNDRFGLKKRRLILTNSLGNSINLSST